MLAIDDRVDYHALNFSPFFDNENRYLLNPEDLDPDINYYNNISLPDTLYKLPSDLMSQTSEKSSSTNFSLLHANCRGLKHNFHKLFDLVTSAATDPSIIAVTETWTDAASETDFNISGYSFEVKSRQHKQCGGVGFFINNSFNYKQREDLCINVPDIIESIFIELVTNNVVIGCVYRPPRGDVAEFTSHIDSVLNKINKEKKYSYIAGDFDIDLQV